MSIARRSLVIPLVLLASSVAAYAEGTTILYSINPDGSFTPTATYLVDSEEALDAYAQSEASTRDGEGFLYAAQNGEPGALIGSASGFVEFLEDNYPLGGQGRTNQACDTGATVTAVFTCPGDCPSPPGTCLTAGGGTVTVACMNSPPCPTTGKTTCAAFPGRITGLTTNQLPCGCDSNDDCQVQAGTTVTGFVGGPVCECVGLVTIPTVSEWGLIIMTVLAFTAGTVLFSRRRRAAAA